MLKLGQTGSRSVLVEHRPARAVLLVALLVVVLATTPLWLAPAPSAPRIATAFVLFAVALGLAALGRQRRRDVDDTTLSGATFEATVTSVKLLRGSPEEPHLYGAGLHFENGSVRLVLAGTDPAVVLGDALRLARELDVPLEPGWGLERHFGEVDLRGRFPHDGPPQVESDLKPHAAGVLELPFWHAQRRVALTTLWAGAFVLAVTVILTASPHRSAPPAALSLVLPAISVVFLLLLGSFFLGVRRKVRLSATGVEIAAVWFGRELSEFRRIGSGLVSAYDVAPDAGSTRHLLLMLEDRAVAFVSDVPALFSAPRTQRQPSRPASREPAEHEQLRAI